MERDKYESRKARSIKMLNDGVEPINEGKNEYLIPSQTEKNRKYKVTINAGWYSCECPDNQESHNLCKHILFLKTFFAIKLSRQKYKKLVSVVKPCPRCESKDVIRYGLRKTLIGKKQIWRCRDCNKRFVNEPTSRIKGNADCVTMAIDLYMKGVSYRGVADSIRQVFGLKITHVTVMNWVYDYMANINDYVAKHKPEVGDVWHADEQFIKADGREAYVWNVLDGKTRFLLASNQSPTRTQKDAVETFQKAKLNAGKRASLVVTDGAFSYGKAVQKEFATYDNPKPHYRYVSLRAKDSSNNNIERFHESFRQRDKVMRGFKGNQKQYAENFRTYYNFVRQHQGLKQTPAQKAGIQQKPEWKSLLLEAIKK